MTEWDVSQAFFVKNPYASLRLIQLFADAIMQALAYIPQLRYLPVVTVDYSNTKKFKVVYKISNHVIGQTPEARY